MCLFFSFSSSPPGDHEVTSAMGHDPVGRDGTHGESAQQRLKRSNIESHSGVEYIQVILVLTVLDARITIRKLSNAPAVPIMKGRRMNISTPNMFWMHGRNTPIIVPILAGCKHRKR